MKRSVGFIFAILLSIGCTDPTVGIINGTVLVDGEAPETGSIVFAPTDGKHGPSGGTITDGAYEVTVPVGTSKIEVRVPVVVGQTRIYNTKDSPIQDVMEESLPAKYNDNSELTLEVTPGKSTHDFDLESKKLKKKK